MEEGADAVDGGDFGVGECGEDLFGALIDVGAEGGEEEFSLGAEGVVGGLAVDAHFLEEDIHGGGLEAVFPEDLRGIGECFFLIEYFWAASHVEGNNTVLGMISQE